MVEGTPISINYYKAQPNIKMKKIKMNIKLNKNKIKKNAIKST